MPLMAAITGSRSAARWIAALCAMSKEVRCRR
jgi:hypothetical protein